MNIHPLGKGICREGQNQRPTLRNHDRADFPINPESSPQERLSQLRGVPNRPVTSVANGLNLAASQFLPIQMVQLGLQLTHGSVVRQELVNQIVLAPLGNPSKSLRSNS